MADCVRQARRLLLESIGTGRRRIDWVVFIVFGVLDKRLRDLSLFMVTFVQENTVPQR